MAETPQDYPTALPMPDTAVCSNCGDIILLEPGVKLWVHLDSRKEPCSIEDDGPAPDNVMLAVALLREAQQARGVMDLWKAERIARAETVSLPALKTRVPSKWVIVDLEKGNVWEATRSDSGLKWRAVRHER